MNRLQWIVADAPAMRALGGQLASVLVPGAVVLLRGPLGAGKTTLAQGIAAGLGVPGLVSSPSFVLVREYPLASGTRLLHLDFYRLAGADEVRDLGVVEEMGSPETIVLIEWPEHGEGALPADAILVDIAMAGDRRVVTLMASGRVSCSMIGRLVPQAAGAAARPGSPVRPDKSP